MNIGNENFLKPHNKELLEQIECAINNGKHSIFYSEATGLGKSYIFMKLIYNNFKNKKILYIVPKIAIFNYLEMTDCFKEISDNITMSTFTAFNNSEYIYEVINNYDLIFVDECHHLQSDIQGVNIVEAGKLLCEKGGYFIGTTATPECIGRRITNVKMLFDAQISGLSIQEAINIGLFPSIDYCVALHNNYIPENYKGEISIDINSIYINNTINKFPHVNHWIVYFSNITKMNKNKAELEKIFPDYKFMVISSNDKDYSKIIEEFDSYDGKIMLLSVNILLEGLHLNSVGGVILFRNSSQMNVLLQIIGRICKINNKISPVFIDIYDSIDNISSSKIIKNINKEKKNKSNNRKIFNISLVSLENIDICEKLNLIINNYKIYRGITITDNMSDVSRQLGKSINYTLSWLCRHPDKTIEDCIDYVKSKDSNKSYIYRGITITDNMSDVSRQLGRSCKDGSTWLHRNPDKTVEDYIDYVKSKDSNNSYTYRGITITDKKYEIARQLGKSGNSICSWLRCNPDKTVEDYIDYVKGIYTYKGITITNNKHEIARQLGKSGSAIRGWLHYNPDKTVEDYIDYVKSKDSENSYTYKGITITNKKHEIDSQLGRSGGTIYGWLRNHPDKTVEDYIDYVKSKDSENSYTYKGITITNKKHEIDSQLGRSGGTIYGWLRRHPDKTVEDYIDYVKSIEDK